VELLPSIAPELMAYCREKRLRPLGLVIVAEDGQYADYSDSDYVSDSHVSLPDQSSATKLFQAHAHFWFCVVPWLAEQGTNA